MPTVEVSLPTDLEAEFERVASEEFVNREEAAEELLRLGIDAYATGPTETEETDFAEEYADEMFDTAEEDPSERFDDDTGGSGEFR